MIKNNKIKNLLIICAVLLVSIVILPTTVSAKNNDLSVYLKCPANINRDSIIVCDLYAESNGINLNGFQADIVLGDGVKLNSFTPNEKMSGGFNNNKILYIGSWKGKTKIGVLNLSIAKNIENIKIDIVDIASVNESSIETVKGEDYSFNYELPSSKAVIVVALLIIIPLALIVAIIILIKKKKGGNKK